MLGVAVVRTLRLGELRPELEKLKTEVKAGRVFRRFYLRAIDEAASALGILPACTEHA
jgi:hypothetical protein